MQTANLAGEAGMCTKDGEETSALTEGLRKIRNPRGTQLSSL